MGNIVRHQSAPLALSSPQLAQHLEAIERRTGMAMFGMEQLKEIYNYAEYTVSSSLAAAQMLQQLASYQGTLTPSQNAELQAMRQQFLEQVRLVTGQAGQEIMWRVANAPIDEPDSWLQQILDSFNG